MAAHVRSTGGDISRPGEFLAQLLQHRLHSRGLVCRCRALGLVVQDVQEIERPAGLLQVLFGLARREVGGIYPINSSTSAR